MGHERVTQLGLEVIEVDAGRNLLIVRGAVPGPKGGSWRCAVPSAKRLGGQGSLELPDRSSASPSTTTSCTRRCAPSSSPGAAAPRPRSPAARSGAAVRSRGARRAPGGPGSARSARHTGPEAASPSGRAPRAYTVKVNPRRAGARCERLSACTPPAAACGPWMHPRSTRPPRRPRLRARRPRRLRPGARAGRRRGVQLRALVPEHSHGRGAAGARRGGHGRDRSRPPAGLRGRPRGAGGIAGPRQERKAA